MLRAARGLVAALGELADVVVALCEPDRPVREAPFDHRPVDVAYSATLGHLKHGPGGMGGRGPCDADCRKCRAERTSAVPVVLAAYYDLTQPGLVRCQVCGTEQRPGAVHFATLTEQRPCPGSWARKAAA